MLRRRLTQLFAGNSSYLPSVFHRKQVLSVENGYFFGYRTSTTDAYQYLQKSIIPTMHFQKSLPHLPIPELEKTCEKYLNSLKPITSNEKFQRTVRVVDEFRSAEGKDIHEQLKAIDRKNKHTSYISGPWSDMYLRSRESVVLNFNPFMSFKDDPDKDYNTQLIKAANMLISSLRFLKSLKEGILEPEVFHLNPSTENSVLFKKITRSLPESLSWYGAYIFKAYPLDMSQFRNLFNSTRVPRIGKDEIQVFPDSRHVLVLRNGYFYVFDVFDGDGNILPPSHIYSYLNYVIMDRRPPPSHPISYLTTENRDTWANAREHIKKLGNRQQLQLIDSAIFALILDDSSLENDLIKSAHHMLHGPAFNRWFDKSFQMIITRDGKAALNFEHSWGDGVAVLRFFNEVYKDFTTKHFIGPNVVHANVDASHGVRRLDFTLDESIKSAIRKAQDSYSKITSSLQFNILQYDKMNRESIKSYKISPDYVAQIGFQMAFYKVYGKFVATYESCSTAAFKHGRTETVRPITMASKTCVEDFHKSNRPSSSLLRSSLQECSRIHNQLTKEAAMGQGFDRHLFCLKYIADKNSVKLPALYEDEAYKNAMHFILSTSTLFGPAFEGGGFGPVAQDGFGIGYGFIDNYMGFLISSYSPFRDGDAFVNALKLSFDEIYEVLESTKSHKIN